MSLLLSL